MFVHTGLDYSFARRATSAPLTAVEIPSAGREHAIVLPGVEQRKTNPAAILAVEDKPNLYVTGEGGWKAHDRSASVCRFPSIVAAEGEDKTFTSCIGEAFARANQEVNGRPLFDGKGERTGCLEDVLKFLQDQRVQHQRTKAFIQRFEELKLLGPVRA